MARDLAALLRTTEEVTDSHVIAAKRPLVPKTTRPRRGPSEPATKPFAAQEALSNAGSADETIPDNSIPLTRRK